MGMGSGGGRVASASPNWTVADAQAEQQTYDFNVKDRAFKVQTDYFQTAHSWDINEQLRDVAAGKRNSLDVREQNNVDAMDSYMRPLSKPVTVYRFVERDTMNFFGITSIENPNSDEVVGTHITDPAFMSTSYDVTANVFKHRDILLRMHVPKGHPAIIPDNAFESEIALSRNTGYTITGVRREMVKLDRFNSEEKLVIDVVVDKPKRQRRK